MAASAGCGAGRLCFLYTDKSPWTAKATVLNEYFCRSQNLLSTHFKVFSWTLAMSDAALLLLSFRCVSSSLTFSSSMEIFFRLASASSRDSLFLARNRAEAIRFCSLRLSVVLAYFARGPSSLSSSSSMEEVGSAPLPGLASSWLANSLAGPGGALGTLALGCPAPTDAAADE